MNELKALEYLVKGVLADESTPQGLRDAVSEIQQELNAVFDKHAALPLGKEAIPLALMSFLSKVQTLVE